MSWLRTLVARLLLAGLFLALLLLAANPILRIAVMRRGRALTGTRFSVDSVRSSFSSGYLALVGCKAAHPFRADQQLFTAESMVFDFDRTALSRRQFWVTRATVDGLRLGGRRSSAALFDDENTAEYIATLLNDFDQGGQEWLNRADRQLEAEEQAEFASTQHAAEVLERWPVQMEALRRRSEMLAERVDHLKADLFDAGENPLRNLESYLVAISEAQSLGREMEELRGESERMEQQLLMDQDKLAKLSEVDAKRLTQELDVLGLNSEELSAYFLGPEVSAWVSEAVSWVHWSRHFLPALGQQCQRQTSRGETIWFPGTPPEASLRIENMVLRGTLPAEDQQVGFEGRVRGIASPDGAGQTATELVLQTTSDAPLLVQAKLGAGEGAAADEIIVNLPSHPQPKRQLGDDQRLAISVDPTPAHVWMKLQVNGDSLSGQMVVKEQPSGLSLAIRNRSIGETLSRLIEEALDDVHRIDMEVTLSGTLDHPSWQITSNLGPQLAVSMRTAVEQQLIRRRRALLASQFEGCEVEVEALVAQLHDLRVQVVQQVEGSRTEIARLKETIASRVQQTDGLVDPDSPLREVFLR